MTKTNKRGKRKIIFQWLGFSLFSLLLIFAVDRLLKFHYYSKTYRYYEAGEVYVEDEKTKLLFSPDRHLFWKIKPNILLKITENPEQYDLYTVGTKPGHYFFVVKSNSHGLNSPEIGKAKPAGTVRVATLGDSRTMAEGIPFEKLYSRQLESLLNSGSHADRFEVINGGVSGYSSYQGLNQLKRNLLEYDLDYVTVLFGINDQDLDLGVSDVQRAEIFDTPLSTIRGWANRSMIYYFLNRQALQLKGLIFGKTPMRSPQQEQGSAPVRRVSLSEYESNLNAFADLGQEHGFTPLFLIVSTSPYAYYPSLFEETVSDFQSDDLTTFRQALIFYKQRRYEEVLELLEPILEERDYVSMRRIVGQTYQQQGRFDEAHRQFLTLNRKIIFADYAEVVRKVARERELPLVDLTPEFTQLTREMLYVDDMHPSERGHELIARKIALALEEAESGSGN